MTVNIFDTFTKCSAVILGDVNFDLLNLFEDEEEKKLMTDILLETKETTLKSFNDILRKFNVKVYRPNIIKYNNRNLINMPFMTLKSINHCLCPSDNLLFLENSMVEMSSVNPNNYFDSLHYTHIFNEFFERGSHWLSMPRPVYDIEQNKIFKFFGDKVPLADAPAFIPYGDTIFYSATSVANQKGMQWMRKQFQKFNFIEIANTHGHLDSYIKILKPGVILSNFEKSALPNFFKNWKVVKLEKENYTGVKFMNELLQDNDYENTNLSVNGFSIDENHLIINEHVIDNQLDLIKQIEKEHITIIPIQFHTAKWINQGLSCICNAIIREGNFQNYESTR